MEKTLLEKHKENLVSVLDLLEKANAKILNLVEIGGDLPVSIIKFQTCDKCRIRYVVVIADDTIIDYFERGVNTTMKGLRSTLSGEATS